MKNGLSFPFQALTGKRGQPADAMLDFIDLLPHGAVLIDERTGRIEAANPPFCKLASLTAGEVVGRDINRLLPGWEDGNAPVLPSVTPPTDAFAEAADPAIARATTPFATVTFLPAAPKGKRVLLVQPPQPEPPKAFSEQDFLQFCAGLNRLLAAFQPAALEPALLAALEAIRDLTGADVLAIYRLQSDQPVLQCCTGLGDPDQLPNELAAQELIALSRPRIWQAGARPTCSLQRQARAARMAYLLSAPIGQPRAVVGLVAVGGRQPPETGLNHLPAARPLESYLPVIQLLAAAVTALFQQHAREETQSRQGHIQDRRERLVAAIEERTYEGVIVLNAQLQILRLNPAAKVMLGYAGDEVTGQIVDKVLVGPESLTRALQTAQKGSSTYQMNNVRLYRRNGEAFLALMRVFSVAHAGQIEHVLVLLQDLSEQEQIRQQTQQLEQRALLGEVTAVFAHEVRNPINNISTGLQVMAMNLRPDDPNQAAIARMLQDCDRLAELMRSVLAFARPADYEMEPLALGPLLNRLLERQHPRIVKHNVQYSLRSEDDCPRILGNPRALEQVFTNLIGNALQAMTETTGHLIIKVCPVNQDNQKYVEVSVADTGPGIPRELQERVFQPFFTTEKGGTGLGLAIVKRIITAHKGNITLTSFPGGTIFRVRLPAHED